MDDTPEKMFVRFNDYAPSIDAASIRKWSTSKFDGGTEYTRTPPKSEPTDGAPETIWARTDLTTNSVPMWDDGYWSIREADAISPVRAYTRTDLHQVALVERDARIAELARLLSYAVNGPWEGHMLEDARRVLRTPDTTGEA